MMTTYEAIADRWLAVERAIASLDEDRKAVVIESFLWLVSQWELTLECTGDIQAVIDTLDRDTQNEFYRAMIKNQTKRFAERVGEADEFVESFMSDMFGEED